MALEEIFDLKKGSVNGLPLAKGEEANLSCYFTPHFFAIETAEGVLLSTQPLTLRQIIALLDEKGYNYSELKVYYNLEEIKLKSEKKIKSEKAKVEETSIEVQAEIDVEPSTEA